MPKIYGSGCVESDARGCCSRLFENRCSRGWPAVSRVSRETFCVMQIGDAGKPPRDLKELAPCSVCRAAKRSVLGAADSANKQVEMEGRMPSYKSAIALLQNASIHALPLWGQVGTDS